MNKFILLVFVASLFSNQSQALQSSDVQDIESFLLARTGTTMNVCVYGPSLAKTLVRGSQLSILGLDDSDLKTKRVRVTGSPTGVKGFSLLRINSHAAPVLVEGAVVLNHEKKLVDRKSAGPNGTERDFTIALNGSVDFRIGNVELTVVSLTPTSIIATADRTVVIISDAGTETCSGKSIDL